MTKKQTELEFMTGSAKLLPSPYDGIWGDAVTDLDCIYGDLIRSLEGDSDLLEILTGVAMKLKDQNFEDEDVQTGNASNDLAIITLVHCLKSILKR